MIVFIIITQKKQKNNLRMNKKEDYLPIPNGLIPNREKMKDFKELLIIYFIQIN